MNGPDAQRYTEDMIKGWKDPAPYPFVLAGVTPSLGTEHLIVPAGAGQLGVFSLASGLMVHSFPLPGVGNDDIAAMTTLRNPNPTGEVSSAFVPGKGAAGGVGASVRALLAVATECLDRTPECEPSQAARRAVVLAGWAAELGERRA